MKNVLKRLLTAAMVAAPTAILIIETAGGRRP